MKRAQLFLKRRLLVLAQLEEHECFISRFNFALPAVNGFDARQNVRARGELFCDQLIGNPTRSFSVRKRAQREQNFFSHLLGRYGRLASADPAAAKHNVVVVNYCGLSGRHRALRIV